MISACSKRVIVIGDWPHTTSQWIDIDDSNNFSKSWRELFPTKILPETTNQGRFSRIIDTSEFVIRCSWLRTQEPVGFFGRKIDAIQSHPRSLLVEKQKVIELERFFYNTDSVLMEDKGLYKGYKLQSSKLYPKELWVTVSDIYRKINQKANSDVVFPEELFFKNLLDRCNSNIRELQKFYSPNTKMLSTHEYINLWEEVKSYHIDFDDMIELFRSSLWGKNYLKIIDKDYNKFKTIINGQLNSMYINRGTQSIYIAMNDDRFKDYDKYIIGFLGIDQTLKHNATHYNQMAEYRMITDWIRSGKIKYLPEHGMRLSSKLESDLKKGSLIIK